MSFGIMLHSGLCHIRDYVAFGGPVVRAYSMSFGILSDVGVSCIGSLIILYVAEDLNIARDL